MKLNHYEKEIVKKFKHKNYQSNGFLRYSFWSKRIKDLYGEVLTKYERRKIFNNLLHCNYFFRQKTLKSSYLYQFTVKGDSQVRDESYFTISFD
jgi:hypothetical protein